MLQVFYETVGDCGEGILLEYSVDGGANWHVLLAGTVNQMDADLINIRVWNDKDCCVSYIDSKSVGRLEMKPVGPGNLAGEFQIKEDDHLFLYVYPCGDPSQPDPEGDDDCQPWYGTVRKLVNKANCICKRYQVTAIPTYTPDGATNNLLFYITDECNDGSIVAAVYDPNYLLPTIERYCEGDITPGEIIVL